MSLIAFSPPFPSVRGYLTPVYACGIKNSHAFEMLWRRGRTPSFTKRTRSSRRGINCSVMRLNGVAFFFRESGDTIQLQSLEVLHA